MASLTPGYSFGSSEQVTNSKLASLVSGGTVSSIVDADISSSAAITLSKINITAASINYDRLNLGGNIVNADINASAAIVDSKLATISTAGKISGAALTSLSSTPSGAGVLPIANIATGTPTGSKFVRDDGTLQVITGIPKTLIGTWSDTTGASVSNTGQATNNSTVIDSGTDWAGKIVTVIATLEARTDTSFTAVYPVIKNTSTTALSAMQFNSGTLGFVIYTLTLATNSFTVLFGNGLSGTTQGVGIGTNSSGNLILGSAVSSSAGANVSYTKLAGTILRAP